MGNSIGKIDTRCACTKPPEHSPRTEMRQFITEIANHARKHHTNAIVTHTNGLDLGATDADTRAYFQAINGVITESVFFKPHNGATVAQPLIGTRDTLTKCSVYRREGKSILAIEYIDPKKPLSQGTADERTAAALFERFQATTPTIMTADPLLQEIPTSQGNMNSENVSTLDKVTSFAYVINSGDKTKQDMMERLQATPHDLFVLDYFAAWQAPYTKEDIAALQTRNDGSRRLLLGYISVGEAAKHFYYWKKEWEAHPPCWVAGANDSWGSIHAKYWCPEWKKIIAAYVDTIMALGFDGVVLDTVDAYASFEGN